MIWQLIHIIDIMLWIFIAISVMYVFFFSMVSLFHKRKKKITIKQVTKLNKFLILFPAYNEDRVITKSIISFLDQNYPSDKYDVLVVSDHNKADTDEALRDLSIKLVIADYHNSSKAKAMKLAIRTIKENYDYIVILDADDVVKHNFLHNLNNACADGNRAFQCHRCAKNSDTDIAVLDGTSEEINNTIFRKAHNIIGLSSALIGSGMCIDFDWFKNNVEKLSTSGEDRELEAMLLKDGIYIHYLERIPVFDEKVSDSKNFQNQRLRWMTAQIQCLINMIPYIPKAIVKGNIDYIDKTVQQILIPRVFLIILPLIIAIVHTILVPCWSIKWWCLFIILCISLYAAIPFKLRHNVFSQKIIHIPSLFMRMFFNIFHIDTKNNDFIHTKHK
ncbi:MAG TPA: glycosyltransferase [Xylanibacter oryzae]|nr:glycosyltransferase [Xylanibacter oryzae]